MTQTVETLLSRISELAMMWRGQPENRKPIEFEYHETYKKLRSLGWDETFDIDCMLPDENMPKEYVKAHPYIPSTKPWTSSWRKVEEMRPVQKHKANFLQKLKEWLK